MGSGIFVEGCSSTGPRLVPCRDHMLPHAFLWGLNKRRTSLRQGRNLNVGSAVVYRALKKCKLQLGSFQGNRCALRSIVGVMHKGRAQPDSVHRPRDGPKSIYWKLNKSCALGSDYERLYPLHDSAWFTVGT